MYVQNLTIISYYKGQTHDSYKNVKSI
jgi:hypothetical protein